MTDNKQMKMMKKVMKLLLPGIMCMLLSLQLSAQGWELEFSNIELKHVEELSNGDLLVNAEISGPSSSRVYRIKPWGHIEWFVDLPFGLTNTIWPVVLETGELLEELPNGNLLVGGEASGSIILIELAADGSVLRSLDFNTTFGIGDLFPRDIVTNSKYETVLTMRTWAAGDNHTGIMVIDSSWNLMHIDTTLVYRGYASKIRPATDSSFYILSETFITGSFPSVRNCLMELTYAGNTLDSILLPIGASGSYQMADLRVLDEKIYCFIDETWVAGASIGWYTFDFNFNLIDSGSLLSTLWYQDMWVADFGPDSSIYFAGVLDSTSIGHTFYARANYDGSPRWRVSEIGYGHMDIVPLSTGGAVALMYDRENAISYLRGVDANGEHYSNDINVQAYHDLNGNCTYDAGDRPASGYIIEHITPNGDWGVTDSSGLASLPSDSGYHEIKFHLKNNLWTANSCTDTLLYVDFDSTYQDTTVYVALSPLASCTELSANISAAFLRLCFPSTYTVSYCNDGTLPTYSAAVRVILDPWLTYNFSSIPPVSISGDTLWYNLDTIEVAECGSFSINVNVDCSARFGQTHCSQVHIYPDSLCIPTPAVWDSSNLKVTGSCFSPDSVQFRLENTGTGNMSSPEPLIVIEDDIMLMADPVQLNAGEVRHYSHPANGSTWRYIAYNTPGNKRGAYSTHAIEGCGVDSMGLVHTGFVTQFPEDDEPPYIDMDCQQNVASYDPNDKTSYPEGWGFGHFIEANTPMEYRIRFQNTGTDTAFNIYILDTINTAVLDLTSMEVLTASHPYSWEIHGSNVVEFSFSNIMLPDSNVSEPNSHGFIKYAIDQIADLSDGTVIPNRASIYFDFNEPVHTNTAFNTIGYLELIVDSTVTDTTTGPDGISDYHKQVSITASPNPFKGYTYVTVDGINDYQQLEMIVYDLSGREVKKVGAANTNTIRLDGAGLSAGSYLFRITANGQWLGTGKLVVR